MISRDAFAADLLFQSTLLMRGATSSAHSPVQLPDNFNPRSSCEERQGATRGRQQSYRFQSTLLMRGATRDALQELTEGRFQSTLLMRGATTPEEQIRWQSKISIHAPHARSDDSFCMCSLILSRISIHAPHARSDGNE